MKNKAVMFQRIRSIASAILLVGLLGSCEKEQFDPALTREFAVQSTANGAIYNIRVGLPANYNPDAEKYASIYVLDGEETFEFCCGLTISLPCNLKRITDHRTGTKNIWSLWESAKQKPQQGF